MSNWWGGKNPIPSKRVNNPGHEPFKGLSEEWSRFWMEPTVEVGETVQRETIYGLYRSQSNHTQHTLDGATSLLKTPQARWD